jgi:Trypsin-like peptidase domain
MGFRVVPTSVLLIAGFLAPFSTLAQAQSDCPYAAGVCAVRASVFAISSDYDPLGSAVRIAPDRLVTNRHLVVDLAEVEIIRSDGSKVVGTIVPTSYPGDLVMIEVDLGDGPVIALDDDEDPGPYQAVGAEIATEEIRIYPAGRRILQGDTVGARLHHQAYSQPGNSGGALVDGEGELVGIVASGGQGMNEAVPVRELARLQSMSGPSHAPESRRIGLAFRGCDQMVEEAKGMSGQLPVPILSELEQACLETGNRQMIDFAATEAGRHGAYELSARLFESSLEIEPEAVKTRLGYLTTLLLLGRYEDEVPIIRALLDLIPEEPTLQRFAVQAGKWGGDLALAERGIALIRENNPQMAEAAQRFLDADIPAPPPRRSQ